jgi:hypothetical protein
MAGLPDVGLDHQLADRLNTESYAVVALKLFLREGWPEAVPKRIVQGAKRMLEQFAVEQMV